MKLDYKDIGARIREIRKKRGFTQEKLGEIAEVEPSNISHIERTATKVSLPTLLSIANALEVSLDELVYGSLIKNKHISSKVIDEQLSDCSAQEIRLITEIIKTTKKILRDNK